MEKNNILRSNIAFVIVITVSMIFPAIALFDVLFKSVFLQLLLNLYFGPALISAAFIIAGLIAYAAGCINLARAKGSSNAYGLIGFVPIVGILLLIISKDKIKDKTISAPRRFASLYAAAILATLLPFIAPSLTTYLNGIDNARQIINNSGFSKDETEAIITAVEKQKNVKESEILSIQKIDAIQADIMVGQICGTLCGSGTYYRAKKADGKWTIEDTGAMWIS